VEPRAEERDVVDGVEAGEALPDAVAVGGEDLEDRAGKAARTSSRVPTARSFPSSRNPRRVAYSASSMYGVETTIVSPSWWSSLRTSQNSRRETGSTPVVGSSRRRRRGRVRSAATRASFCFIPPESAPARRAPNGAIPTRSRSSDERVRASAAGTE
jgi:Protein of unknown function (DUF1602).